MLEVLDTAGQEEYTALRDQWIRDGEGFVLVYSISSRSSFTRISKFHSHVQRVKESSSAVSPSSMGYSGGYSVSGMGSPASMTLASSAPRGQVPIMLVGNKSDRVTEREVSTQEGQALARDLGCDFVEASAKNCINVEKAFYDVVRALKRQRQQANPKASGSKSGNLGGGGSRDLGRLEAVQRVLGRHAETSSILPPKKIELLHLQRRAGMWIVGPLSCRVRLVWRAEGREFINPEDQRIGSSLEVGNLGKTTR
ncbi:MAG: Ras GTPase ras2 [Sclerophora amabilis]|nr:MAG: Ras GTPase ras2 [Sclerophora amabilis]